jgi:hypothetical protein
MREIEAVLDPRMRDARDRLDALVKARAGRKRGARTHEEIAVHAQMFAYGVALGMLRARFEGALYAGSVREIARATGRPWP